MKQIFTASGDVFLVDDDDYIELSKYRWYSLKTHNSIYAHRKTGYKNYDQQLITMHREIMGNPPGLCIDHINHNTQDNRKENLRICTNAQNKRNSKKRVGRQYKGVYLSKRNKVKKYLSAIGVCGKTVWIGSYYTPEEAALAYDNKAKELFGEYACLNFQ